MAEISYDKHGAVRLITINRADKMNSLDFAANDELIEVWREFDRDDQARVAVITGAGDKAFCAGADLKTYTLAFAQASAPEFRAKYTNGPGFGGITRNLDIDKPILAAVNGFAISGGFELSLACDMRFCSVNAEFALQDAKWGFHACDGGLIRLPQIVGMGHAMEIVLSGERVNADHAYRIGLVNRVVPPTEVNGYAQAQAKKLAAKPLSSLVETKRLMKGGQSKALIERMGEEGQSFRRMLTEPAAREAFGAFMEKRKPDFSKI